MTKLLMKVSRIPAVALMLVLWSCTDLAEPTRLMGPGEMSRSDGTTTVPTYRPIKGVWSNGRSDSKVIRPNTGGMVEVAGNSIEIPAGAVTEPTLFEMKLAKKDKDGYTIVQVDLRAYQQDSAGNYTVDVGSQGFLKPIRLQMTYEWATDPVSDPSLLRIVWMKADGTQEVYKSKLSASTKRIVTQLNHFSDYAIGFPDAL